MCHVRSKDIRSDAEHDDGIAEVAMILLGLVAVPEEGREEAHQDEWDRKDSEMGREDRWMMSQFRKEHLEHQDQCYRHERRKSDELYRMHMISEVVLSVSGHGFPDCYPGNDCVGYKNERRNHKDVNHNLERCKEHPVNHKALREIELATV